MNPVSRRNSRHTLTAAPFSHSRLPATISRTRISASMSTSLRIATSCCRAGPAALPLLLFFEGAEGGTLLSLFRAVDGHCEAAARGPAVLEARGTINAFFAPAGVAPHHPAPELRDFGGNLLVDAVGALYQRSQLTHRGPPF